jgi:hypothetical protein
MEVDTLARRSLEATPGLAAPLRGLPGNRLRRFSSRIAPRVPALLPALLFLPVVFAPPFNHDVAAILQWSQRWLDGERLYTDLVDVNPPLIFIFNLLPAAIAKWTPIEAPIAFRLCLIAFGLVCWWLSVLARDRSAEGPAERAFLDVLPGLFLFGAGYDFGQREHIMAIASLPYLFAASRRASGEVPRGRLAGAVIAATMFALKPYFLGIPALIEFAVLIGRRPRGERGRDTVAGLGRWLRDPVPWVMMGIWATYLASIPVLFPDFLNVVVPLIFWAYLEDGLSCWQTLASPRVVTVLYLLLPLLWCAFRRLDQTRFSNSRLVRLFALAALGALISAFAQHKGWSYHIVPIEFFACSLGGLLASRWLDELSTGPIGHPHRAAAVLAWLFVLYSLSNGEAPWKEIHYADSDVARLTALLRQNAAGKRILALSVGVYPIYPAVNYAGARMMLPTMNMWPLERAYVTCLTDGRRYGEGSEMKPAEHFLFRTVAENFARQPPDVVIVDSTVLPQCGAPFDFIGYFSHHPLFAATWSHYKLSGISDRYRVYTRN